MVFNATFNNISDLLVEETGIPDEIHGPAQVTDKLDHMNLYLVHFAMSGIKLITLVVICTVGGHLFSFLCCVVRVSELSILDFPFDFFNFYLTINILQNVFRNCKFKK